MPTTILENHDPNMQVVRKQPAATVVCLKSNCTVFFVKINYSMKNLFHLRKDNMWLLYKLKA